MAPVQSIRKLRSITRSRATPQYQSAITWATGPPTQPSQPENGSNVLKYHGIAPEATIVTVKLLNSPTPASDSTPAGPEFQPLNLIPTALASGSDPGGAIQSRVFHCPGFGKTRLWRNTAPYRKPVLPVSVTVSGVPALFNTYGEAPGELAGVMQLNVEIPAKLLLERRYQ